MRRPRARLRARVPGARFGLPCICEPLMPPLVRQGAERASLLAAQVLNYQRDGCAPRWLTMGAHAPCFHALEPCMP